MTIHYHGTPITPRRELLKMAGANFCVSFAAPADVRVCHQVGQSVMLDNGAFSVWRRRVVVDWDEYYRWCEPWLKHWTTWAVIPDVIDGGEKDNDALIEAWPFGDRGAPVWHLHESIDRLLMLCRDWPRVCFGSSGDYSRVGTPRWHQRMTEAMNALCGDGPPPCWLHLLRGMSLSGSHYPFASVDSTDVARNHNRTQNSVLSLRHRWDGSQCAAEWVVVPEQQELAS